MDFIDAASNQSKPAGTFHFLILSDVSPQPESHKGKGGGAAARAAELGLAPQSVRQETGYTHIFTHIEWHMTVYRIECGAQSPDFLWLTPAEMAEKTAVPSAFRPCLRVLQRAQ